MADLPDRATLFRVFRRAIVSAQTARLNPAVVDIDGSDLNLLAGGSSVEGEAVVAAQAACMQGLWSDTATSDALDRLAYDRYGLNRRPAAAARDVATISRPAPGAAGSVLAGTRISTPDGIVFALDVDAVFAAPDTVQTVSVTALVTGPGGNVGANSLTTFVDAPFDTTMVVTNGSTVPTGPFTSQLVGAAGGTDAESDAQFRGRIRDFFPTLRRGTLGAIEFGARQVPGVAVARAIEIDNPSDGLPAAAVQLIIGDADGNASPPVIQQVIDGLLTFRAGGIPVLVVSGLVVFVPIRWVHLAFETGIDTQLALAQLRAVTVAVAQNMRPGQTLLRSSLIAGARVVPGLIVSDDSLANPPGDLLPVDIHHIIRVRPTDVTFG